MLSDKKKSLEKLRTCGLPGVDGFLDGTHIRLSSALNGERDFYNRKGNVEVSCLYKCLNVITLH